MSGAIRCLISERLEGFVVAGWVPYETAHFYCLVCSVYSLSYHTCTFWDGKGCPVYELS